MLRVGAPAASARRPAVREPCGAAPAQGRTAPAAVDRRGVAPLADGPGRRGVVPGGLPGRPSVDRPAASVPGPPLLRPPRRAGLRRRPACCAPLAAAAVRPDKPPAVARRRAATAPVAVLGHAGAGPRRAA